MLGGTFHSVAHRFVRMHAASLGLAPGFAVLDAGDAADLLDLIREEHGHAQRQRRFPKKSTLLDIYSRTVNAQRTLSEVVAESFPWCEDHVEDIASLLKAYTARKRALGVIDLDDLLLYWRALAADEVLGPAHGGWLRPRARRRVPGRQRAAGRDPARRCAAAAARSPPSATTCRRSTGGARRHRQHILEFADHFPEATLVTLERNYRSSQPILDTANVLAAQASRSYRKQLRTDLEQGARPELIFCRDESAQAVEVCERVLQAREQGMELRSQAVLMRASHDSDLLELELTRRQIPFVKYGGLRYLEAAHVKDLIALFRLVDNPANELSWFRVLQLLEGVGPVTARRVLDSLIAGQAGGADGLAGWDRAREHLPGSVRESADSVIGALRTARGPVATGVAAEALRDALAPLVAARYPDGAVRLADLEQLVAAAREAPDLGHFAAELALDPPQSSSDLAGPPHLDEDYLVLSTIHSAKGLEWGAVHVLALYDGNFPACMSAGTSESIEEERRLLYVAMTRARRRLYLHVPVRYYHRPRGIDDAHGYGKPSRFLTDEVRRTCELTRSGERIAAARPDHPPRKISVSVDALFR